MIIEVHVPGDEDPGYMERAITSLDFMERYGDLKDGAKVTSQYLRDLIEFLAPYVVVDNEDGTFGDAREALKRMSRTDFAKVFDKVAGTTTNPLVPANGAGSDDGQAEKLESPPVG